MAKTATLEAEYTWTQVEQPIDGDAEGKNFLSMSQLNVQDIYDYLDEAAAAEEIIHSAQGGVNLLSFQVLKIIMQQPSTRTGGSMETAMAKLGGNPHLYSGMASSSEAKGESPADTGVAFATQADIIGMRSPNEWGPHFLAQEIARSFDYGKLWKKPPVINLGDGTNEHPSQTIGDLHTIYKRFGELEGRTLTVVGDHERYRAFHSLLIGAATVGMNVIAVECPVAKVPTGLVDLLGDKLTRMDDLDEAMEESDILYVGRNPDEYVGKKKKEKERSKQLAKAYLTWIIDKKRLQRMPKHGIGMHARPRRNEFHPSVDDDVRMVDVEQMENMIPARMAIIARHLGVSML